MRSPKEFGTTPMKATQFLLLASVFAALVSGALGYSTGQVINVDGGLSILRF